MPTQEELNAVSQLLFNCDFDRGFRHDSNKIAVVELALQIKRNELLAAIQNDTDSIAKVMWDR